MAERIQLQRNALQTASGHGADHDVSQYDSALVTVNVTGTNALSDLTCWLEGSDDGGATWYELPADQAFTNSGGGTDPTVTTDDRDVIDGMNGTAKATAVYRHLATDKIRLGWSLTGTSATFDAAAILKEF